jgi:hypothetical protein
MKTPQEWMDAHGYDKSVCCGHGEYWDLPKRIDLDIIARIQADAQAGREPVKVWCRVQGKWVTP